MVITMETSITITNHGFVKKMFCSVYNSSELMPPGETITREVYYLQLAKKRPSWLNRKSVILLHENTRLDATKDTKEYLKAMLHSPCSQDLAPMDYHLFRSLGNNTRNKTTEIRMFSKITWIIFNKIREF